MIRIALVNNDTFFELLRVDVHQTYARQSFDIAELEAQLPHMILFSKSSDETDLTGLLSEQYRFLPVRAMSDFNLNYDNIDSLQYADAKKIYQKSKENWILQNNLNLLENLFANIHHLKELWPNDRTSFMEELWFILRNNLGSDDLVMIYNSLKISGKENEKKSLVQSRVAGTRYPETFDGGDFEKQVMENYGAYFEEKFTIREYVEEKKEAVATVAIKGSPLLIMAKVNSLSRLQQSLLKTLFDGLSAKSL